MESTDPRGTLPRVLTIAGTDPTGGAGVQADLKSFMAAGAYGMSVVTALVAQNTQGVRAVHTPPLSFLQEQFDAVLDDVAVDAVKIGMLGTADIVASVSRFLDALAPNTPIVLDPVMVATSGDRLLDEEAEAAVRELCRQVTVITPNLKELAVLTSTPHASSLDEAISIAQDWASETGTYVIAKGGHLQAGHADNAAVGPEGVLCRVSSPRVDTKNTHGTGCSLSSALAARLGAGETLPDALEWSTTWLHEAIENADGLRVGHGHGPVDHGHQLRRQAGLL
ncbi:bifunctional hydroxymethylpyrimidine kinase/phosphomethylpyrimidine kinase [Corynebacterium striatum]|uniref:bifunctional hydroxymethylpyrimidine kinase/phosphomethylpyrimidine kinase n=1 Tax=Corynebacterium striatum TaxID=43770 RepID=UPI003B5CD0F9|nr:bifunctional hydroxymethylpyrimidine kinase/phosphomethylpyrimidine kinase [Corynebacterium striatum]